MIKISINDNKNFDSKVSMNLEKSTVNLRELIRKSYFKKVCINNFFNIKLFQNVAN